jgi:hypothetical protein
MVIHQLKDRQKVRTIPTTTKTKRLTVMELKNQ